VLTRGKWGLIERFLETVVAKSRDIFVAAERDVEAWIGSLLPPIEAQVREQRTQLVRHAESVLKIRDAQQSLDERIGELEAALASAQDKMEALRRQVERAGALALGSEGQRAGVAPAAVRETSFAAVEVVGSRQRASA
jgi:chromosome segregation ATPase